MTNGQLVIAELEKVLGARENPPGSNWGHPFIEAAHHLYGLGPNPWCAMGAGLAYHRAGVSDSGLIHPYTGFICDRADARGGLRPASRPAPPGSIVIRCGIHIEILEFDRHQEGLLETIGCNVDHSVKRLIRAADEWRLIVPESIAADASPPAPVFRTAYGFDDLNIKPGLYGGWPTRSRRKERRLRFLESHSGWWTREVRVNRPSPFAFYAGRPGTAGEIWRFGGWPSFDARERKLKEHAAKAGHENLRRWSKRILVPRDSTAVKSEEESLT
jgi:hypothetical protein